MGSGAKVLKAYPTHVSGETHPPDPNDRSSTGCRFGEANCDHGTDTITDRTPVRMRKHILRNGLANPGNGTASMRLAVFHQCLYWNAQESQSAPPQGTDSGSSSSPARGGRSELSRALNATLALYSWRNRRRSSIAGMKARCSSRVSWSFVASQAARYPNGRPWPRRFDRSDALEVRVKMHLPCAGLSQVAAKFPLLS